VWIGQSFNSLNSVVALRQSSTSLSSVVCQSSNSLNSVVALRQSSTSLSSVVWHPLSV
jgi:hypothetical protein